MSKKGKKFDTNAEGQSPVATDTTVMDDTNPTTAEATPKVEKPREPSMFIENAAGVQFRFTRYPLPQKAKVDAPAPDGEIIVDGDTIPYFTTHNKGWAVAESFIVYAYMKIGDVAGYVALSGGEVDAFKGAEYKLGQGEANRANPKKVSANPETDKTRAAAAEKTRADNKAKKEAEAAAATADATEGTTDATAEATA
jgi:hypothetical protein